MKIESYAVVAVAKRESFKLESSTTLIRNKAIPQVKQPVEEIDPEKEANAKLSLSELGKKFLDSTKNDNERFMRQMNRLKGASSLGGPKIPSDPVDLKLSLLDQLLYALTGKHFTSKSVELTGQQNSRPDLSCFSGFGGEAPQAKGTFIETEAFSYESESVSYQAQGIINTADGKTISVDVSLSMSRQYAAYTSSSVEMKVKNCVDPLVINYGGTAASLTGERFEFDLNADGIKDLISSLGEGSGFLALDKNGDGKINDGTELFGPNTGSGFGELRGYDKDRNGWIDENDDIFSKLLVWSKDKDGKDQLFYLKELDIGAIYLGDLETEFSINGKENESLGTMRSTSFFLKENGGSGTISHIDLTL